MQQIILTERDRIESLPYRLPEKLTDILKVYIWAVKKKNTSAVGITDGRSGMGKTTLTNQIGKYCDPDYGLHKMHYTPETFLHGGDGRIGLAQAKEGDFIVFDEAMLISSRAALSQINRMIIQAMSMIRSKRIFVWFCVNSVFDIDRNLALSRADILLHLYGEHLADRGKFTAFFKGGDGTDKLKLLYLLGKKYYDYSKPKANFFARFSKHFVVDEELYETQKQLGIAQFLGRAANDVRAQAITHRMNLIAAWKKDCGYSNRKIAELSGVPRQTIDRDMEKWAEFHGNDEKGRMAYGSDVYNTEEERENNGR